MASVKIIGAGSAGNHMAHAFRLRGWDVYLTDIDEGALERTRTSLYPQRYGQWDEQIRLSTPNRIGTRSFDVVAIATPPASHVRLALDELRENSPRILLIEKPLSHPSNPHILELQQKAAAGQTQVLVGYNHNLSDSVQALLQIIRCGQIGPIHSINVDVRENARFILNAHPWLKGVSESYLGSQKEGGGAAFEHSHGVALWLLLAEAGGLLPLKRTFASRRMSACKNYDEATTFHFESISGSSGSVHQDFLTSPPLKRAEIFGQEGRVVWANVHNANHEELVVYTTSEIIQKKFPKQRATDFLKEVDHLEKLLSKEIKESDISLERGIQIHQILSTGIDAVTLNKTVSFEPEYRIEL